jgi:hypothetical protein
MNPSCSSLFHRVRRAWRTMLAAPMGAALLVLAACNGTAVVTLTSTASQDNFLAYRVGLVSVQLQGSGGKSALTVLPSSTTVDFAELTNLSEVLGAAAVSKGSYTQALVTVDYSSAQIVYDDGSVNGTALTPIGVNGQALGQVQITVTLDPNDPFTVASRGASQLALDFSMAASNLVDLSAKTVTVTPLIAASALQIDSKPVRIRGPLAGTAGGSGASTSFMMGVAPFNGTASGAGRLAIVPTDATDYEVNGIESTGSVGLTQLAGLSAGAFAVAYGTLSTADATTTTTSADGTQTTATSANVTFAATEVLAGSSVQGSGLDRVSGTVAARSGNTLSIEDGTLVAADGTETFLGGTTIVIMSANTLITVFGQTVAEINGPQQVSVGSSIDAFGVATSLSADNATLDASAGRIRIDPTSASGLVTQLGSGSLALGLTMLGGRTAAVFDFAGTGADPASYVVDTGTNSLSLANTAVGGPVIVTGFTTQFGAAPPNFTASALLDPTTIQAELIVDWGAGTASPFTTYDSSSIDVDIHNDSIGARHGIEVGAAVTDLIGMPSDPLIVPDATSSTTVFTIGHTASSTMESFNTYAAFIAKLQQELAGSVLATCVTAVGQYTPGTFTLSATSITLFLNN